MILSTHWGKIMEVIILVCLTRFRQVSTSTLVLDGWGGMNDPTNEGLIYAIDEVVPNHDNCVEEEGNLKAHARLTTMEKKHGPLGHNDIRVISNSGQY